MKHLRIITATALLLILTACVNAYPHLTTTFDASEISWVSSEDRGTIVGTGTTEYEDGGIVTCAGAKVLYIPVSTYASELMSIWFQSTDKGSAEHYTNLLDLDDQFISSYYQNWCTASGKFAARLPPGDYYVVTWFVAVGDFAYQGNNYLMQKVTVIKDTDIRINLVYNPA